MRLIIDKTTNLAHVYNVNFKHSIIILSIIHKKSVNLANYFPMISNGTSLTLSTPWFPDEKTSSIPWRVPPFGGRPAFPVIGETSDVLIEWMPYALEQIHTQ